MKAVIMAGGEGSRLRPLTCDLPKPMVPIMNVPVMEHIIDLLKLHGIRDIAVTLMYLPQKVREYFGDGSSLGVNLHYFTEDTPLGTAGSVKNAQIFLDETFIVISGDSLTDINLKNAYDFHMKNKAKGTIVLTKVDIPLSYGVAMTDKKGRITGFLEKPSWGEVFSDTVNTGTYILEPEVLDYFEAGVKYDFSQNLFPMMLRNNDLLMGYISDDYWCDIGNIDAYIQSHYDVFSGKIKLKYHVKEIREGVFIGANTIIDSKAEISGPCLIGRNCFIGPDAVIHSNTVIGNNTNINDSVSIKRSIIWEHCAIEYGSELRASVICNKVNLKNYVSVFENAVIGKGCVINERAIIRPEIKIWPGKIIDPMAIVDRNIIWGQHYTRSIFGQEGISGIINVEVSPEFATRLGAAYGSVFTSNSNVMVSSTPSNSALMFKHAFISGILSVGLEVFNMSSILTPIARHAVNFLPVEGGIHIKVSDKNPNRMIVDFMDGKGAGIPRNFERKIENAFFKEDFRRCSHDNIQRINNITDYRRHYENSILSDVDIDGIMNKNPSVCIVSPSGFAIETITEMLREIGCNVHSYNYANIDAEGTITEKIRKTNSEFAAYIDTNAEKLILLDRNGNKIDDDKFTLLTSLIIFKTLPGAVVIVPITVPTAIEKLAVRYRGSVRRTKTSNQSIMEEMLNNDLFKNSTDLNLSQFLLHFDALAGLVKIIEYLVLKKTTLTELIEEIPVFHISRKKIFCPWEMKGRVMRSLIACKDEKAPELVEGVKFNLKDGWVLILPDADKPVCRIYSEGKTAEIAEVYSLEYMNRIREILGNG